jgi:hypothetical protein
MSDQTTFQKALNWTFSTTLFIACAGFVIQKGYECFTKYMEDPEAVDISYKFTGESIFNISICVNLHSFIHTVSFIQT